MKLDFSCPPLDIFNSEISKALLNEISVQMPSFTSQANATESIFSTLLSRVINCGAIVAADNLSLRLKYKKAKACLNDLILKQKNKVINNPSSLIQEAQINMMATSCVTDCLSHFESRSAENSVKNLAKIAVGLIQLKNPLAVIYESVLERSLIYEDICTIYHIAFLLTVYNSLPLSKQIITQLITEAVQYDMDQSFDSKERPVMFFDVQYKSLKENMTYRLDILNKYTDRSGDLYDTFVTWRQKENDSMCQ